MKSLIKLLAITTLVFGVANCGSKGGGSKSKPKNGISGNAEVILIDANDGDGGIEWSSNYNNIYYNKSASGNCVYGLSTSADDDKVADAVTELQALLAKSSVVAGTGKDFAVAESSLPYIEIDSGDKVEIYYLVDKADVPKSEKVLSNYKEILNFHDDVLADLKAMGNSGYYCPGKASKN